MTYQALYRKLRPNKFCEVFGQDEIVKTLKNQVKNGQIAHAYLFCGTRGTGKTSLAKIMARAVNCLQPLDNEPCGVCEVCQSLSNDSNVDVVEMDAASRNGVDDMRELLERVAYPPQVGKYKVYIIDEVHMLSTSAFNALLKTLEEPPEHVIFILATTESQKIPATILSRCQRYDLNRVSAALIFEKMKAELSTLSLAYEDNAVMELAIAADGSVRDGWSLLDVCISGMDSHASLTAERVHNMLGTTTRKFNLSIASAIVECDFSGLMDRSAELMRNGKEPLVVLKQLAQVFRNMLLVKLCNENIDEKISADEYQALKAMAQKISHKRILSIVDLLMEQELKLKWSSNPRIGFESVLIKAASPLELSFDIIDTVANLQEKVEQLASRKPIALTEPAKPFDSKTESQIEISKPKFTPETKERHIWKDVIKSIHGPIISCIAGAYLYREENTYYVCYPEENRLTYEQFLKNMGYQKIISDLINKLTGTESAIGVRLIKKDNTVNDNMIQQTIKELEESLPSGMLQVTK